MRFLVDECTGPRVARWLRDQGHEVFSVYERARGMDDARVLEKADSENWILITNDKDFGEQVYRGQQPHRGVVSSVWPGIAVTFQGRTFLVLFPAVMMFLVLLRLSAGIGLYWAASNAVGLIQAAIIRREALAAGK